MESNRYHPDMWIFFCGCSTAIRISEVVPDREIAKATTGTPLGITLSQAKTTSEAGTA